MPAYEIHTSQFGLIDHNRQAFSDLVTLVEPKTPFAQEARKGNLYILVEDEHGLNRGQDVCTMVTRILRKAFYNDESLSVTSSLRAAIRAANKAVYQHNLNAVVDRRAYIGMTCAVVKGHDLFLAQVAPAQAYVLTEGKLRAMPIHPSWNPGHTSPTHFLKSGVALGSSLFVEPELYRCLLRSHDTFLLCSSNMSRVLEKSRVENILQEHDQQQALDTLHRVCYEQQLSEAHALLVQFAPATGDKSVLTRKMIDIKDFLPLRSLGAWLNSVTGKSSRQEGTSHALSHISNGSSQSQQAYEEASGDDALHTAADTPDLPANPLPKPRDIDMGVGLRQQYEQQRSKAEAATTEYPGSSAEMGERDDEPLRFNQSVLDVNRLPPSPPEKNPYRPKREKRPWVDMKWWERILYPFHMLGMFLLDFLKNPRAFLGELSGPTETSRHASEEAEKPGFPWLQLISLILFIALLVLYGMNLSRQSAEQKNLEYIEQARQYLVEMDRAESHEVAAQQLENARQALEPVRSSPLVTNTNPVLWLPFQEVSNEYERGLATVQRLTFFDRPTLISEHLMPNGRFASLVVPPPTSNITDTFARQAVNYIYALDGDKNNARLYRIPRDGGLPEPFLSPEDLIQNALVGSIQAQAWRIDNIVAIDQTATNFGYYFRSEGIWNYMRLGGSEIWAPQGRIDLETYEGNLYLWGAEPLEIIKFTSGRYADIPELWLDATSVENIDLSTVVDMEIDGKIYLLTSGGKVMVFSLGKFERNIIPGDIAPPITAVTRMFVTGGPDAGWIFLLDTLNERVLQIDKTTGNVIQQMKVRSDSDLRLNQLTDIYVDDSSGRPILYLVNGGQIIRTGMPAPPRPVDEAQEGP
jgi:serine/threonine protein phosphatase PrpC